MNDTSGLTSSTPFAVYDQSTSSWKMSEHTLGMDSGEYLETFPKQGTMRAGRVYKQQRSASPFCVNGFSFSLDLPDGDKYVGAPVASMKNGAALSRDFREIRNDFRYYIENGHNWGKLETVLARWEVISNTARPALFLSEADEQRLLPNPRFIEWMMSLPNGWVSDIHLSTSMKDKILGNGVCPPQAVKALKEMLNMTAATRKVYHAIRLGDSRELCKTVKRVDCIITDPPFGIDNLSNSAVTQKGQEYARKIANDESPDTALRVFDEVMAVLLPKAGAECDLYVFTAYQVLREWLTYLDGLEQRYGFVRKGLLVWEKEGPGMGDLESWGQGHEFIVFLKKGRRERFAPRRSGVLHIPQLRPNQLIHPHEKPEPLLEILIRHSTQEGDVIVDPFGGSGSVVRAARNCNRSALAIEIDQLNYDKSLKKFNEQEAPLI